MATKVHMEALSPTMEEGQLVRWLKSEGDEVAEGDVLAEIETDKATMELVARGSGVLRKRLLDEGGTAAVGSVIAVIAGPDEDIAGLVGDSTEVEQAARPAEDEREGKERADSAAGSGDDQAEAGAAVAAAGKAEQSKSAAGVDAAAETGGRAPTSSPGQQERQGSEGGNGAGRIKASLAASTGVEHGDHVGECLRHAHLDLPPRSPAPSATDPHQ